MNTFGPNYQARIFPEGKRYLTLKNEFSFWKNNFYFSCYLFIYFNDMFGICSSSLCDNLVRISSLPNYYSERSKEINSTVQFQLGVSGFCSLRKSHYGFTETEKPQRPAFLGTGNPLGFLVLAFLKPRFLFLGTRNSQEISGSWEREPEPDTPSFSQINNVFRTD